MQRVGGSHSSLNKRVGSSPAALDISFINGTSLDSRIAFTRGSTAWRFNSSGLLVQNAIDSPRYNYNPATLSSMGLLIEEQRINLGTYSNALDNIAWTKTRSSVTPNAVIGPDGTLSMDKIVEDTTASSTHFIRQDFAVTSGLNYVKKWIVKAGERTQCAIWFNSDGGCFADENVIFNLTGSGSIASVGGIPVGYGITDLGNGNYFCWVSASCIATGTHISRWFLANGGATSYSGDGTSGIYACCIDYEQASTPTSIIISDTSATTRNADSVIVTDLNSINFIPTTGTIFVECYSPTLGSTNNKGILTLDDGTANNAIQLMIQDAVDDKPVFSVFSGGVAQAVLAGSAVTSKQLIKIAASWSTNSFRLAVNGVSATEDTSGTIPTVTRLLFGQNRGGGSYFNSELRVVKLFNTQLSNTELQALTG